MEWTTTRALWHWRKILLLMSWWSIAIVTHLLTTYLLTVLGSAHIRASTARHIWLLENLSVPFAIWYFLLH